MTVVDVPTQTQLEFREVEGRATWQGPRATIKSCGVPSTAVPSSRRPARSAVRVPRVRRPPPRPGDRAQRADESPSATSSPSCARRGDRRRHARHQPHLRGQGHLAGRAPRTWSSATARSASIPSASTVAVPHRAGVVRRVADRGTPRFGQERLHDPEGPHPQRQPPPPRSPGCRSCSRGGWTDFDGKVNYKVRGDNLVDKLPGKARDLLADLSIDGQKAVDPQIEGALDTPIKYEGVPLNHPLGRSRRHGPNFRRDRATTASASASSAADSVTGSYAEGRGPIHFE